MTDLQQTTKRNAAHDLRGEVANQPSELTERQARGFVERFGKLKASGMPAREALSQAVREDPRGHAAWICPAIQPARGGSGFTKKEASPAAQRFAALVAAYEERGLSRREAMSKAVRDDPDGHAEFIRAAQWTGRGPARPAASDAPRAQPQATADATASIPAPAGEPSDGSDAPKTSTAKAPAARDTSPGTRINFKMRAHIRALSSY